MKAAKKLLIPLLSLALFLGLFNTVFFWGYIPSSSMEPTIHKGDVILGLRLFRELHNGDIIIFERDGRYLVKRIAASSGDSVAIDGASLQVPEKSFYVLGDNASNSFDSRFWSDPFVPLSDVIARVIA